MDVDRILAVINVDGRAFLNRINLTRAVGVEVDGTTYTVARNFVRGGASVFGGEIAVLLKFDAANGTWSRA